MRLQKVQESVIRCSRQMKENICCDGPLDMGATIYVYRGGDLIALGFPLVEDMILRLIVLTAMGFDADAVAVAFDAYSSYAHLSAPGDPSAGLLNPLTGRPWESGEMDDAVENHGAIEKGWVTEALCVTCVNRAGDTHSVEVAYRYEEGKVVWGEVIDTSTFMSDSYLSAAMSAAMNAPSMGTVVPYDPTEEIQTHRDVSTAQIIMQHLPCRIGLLAHAGEEDRIEVLRQLGVDLA